MINKILIANRGEIACRVIATAKKMGIKTVAIYSQIDANSLHVQQADEAVCVGPAPSAESYLRIDKILQICQQLKVDAVHPGYGFLSENASFAEACAQQGVIFIGPPASAIRAMGSKSAAKQIMEAAGVPLVPGYHGDDQSRDIIKHAADEMGYPVLLKAAAGGGGKGMRQVWSESEFDDALVSAKREAKASFGDDIMLVEKYLPAPRHIEIQVFCDQQGKGVYLFERDCSVQRRHQKIIEEAPAPAFSQTLRTQMGEAALRAAAAINYVGAGTVEFLLDTDGSFYFMEMNTRLQVEHPVTEYISQQDLVEWQIRVAQGEALPKAQNELSIHGHAFEARIYAEDPNNQFLPDTGHIAFLRTPTPTRDLRVETGVQQGDDISVHYDPMIAKLVVWGEDRQIALRKLIRALEQYQLAGFSTNVEFLKTLSAHPAFMAAELTTTFIDQHFDSLFATPVLSHVDVACMAAAVYCQRQPHRLTSSVWSRLSGLRLNHNEQTALTLNVNDQLVEVTVTRLTCGELPSLRVDYAGNSASVQINDAGEHGLNLTVDGLNQAFTLFHADNAYTLFGNQQTLQFTHVQPDLGEHQDNDSENAVNAPMNGTVVAVLVSQGDTVVEGTPLVVMEAMKMEHTIKAPGNGIVEELFYQVGDLVDGGQPLVEFAHD